MRRLFLSFPLLIYSKVLSMKSNGGSVAVLIAAIWSGLVHLGLGVLGTFVLKRFPTSFSVGFLLGVLVVIANQNLLLFATFLNFSQGDQRTNDLFAIVGFSVFGVMSLMSLLLFHFKEEVVVAPMDAEKEEDRGNP
jgi:zinc transporter ZupT